MKKTVLIDLYGGPGTGKSTFSAQLFHWFKTNSSSSVEVIHEAAKDHAWINQPIHQPDVFFEQARRVDRLMGVVDVLISDSPLALCAFYGGERWRSLARSVYYLWDQEHQVLNTFLTRTKTYDPRGRYQTEDQARDIDKSLREFLASYRPITNQGTSDEILAWVAANFGGKK